MSEIPETSEITPSPGLSRRRLLKLAGAGAALTTGVGIGVLKASEILEYVLRNPEVLDKTLSLLEDHFINLGVTATENATQITPVINPDRRPIIDIIKEGVNLYGKKVTYNFNPKRKSEEFWENQLAKVARGISTIDMIKVASGDRKAGFLISFRG